MRLYVVCAVREVKICSQTRLGFAKEAQDEEEEEQAGAESAEALRAGIKAKGWPVDYVARRYVYGESRGGGEMGSHTRVI